MLHLLSWLSLALLAFLCGCGEPISSIKGRNYLQFDLSSQIDFWWEQAFLCAGQFPSKAHDDGRCDDGDMTLFNGLLCAAGEDLGCRGVRQAQDQEGRWWRSPKRRAGQGRRPNNSFSRDMSLGVLLYLVKTRDLRAANHWLHWLDKHRPCLVRKPIGGGCVVRGLHRFCTNETSQSCTLTPGIWFNMALVWRHLGLPLHKSMSSALTSFAKHTIIGEAKSTSPGYALHLKAVTSFLYRTIGVYRIVTRELNQVLVGKQPGNIFFKFLKDGPSRDLAQSVMHLCPDQGRFSGRLSQWAWERDTDEKAWLNSMLWDCIFMARLF